jgi:uncharacterized protein (DUF697 family)
MAQSHLFLMGLYAALVAVAGGVLLKDTRREQVRAAGAIFGGLVGAAVLAGWLLYALPL